MFFHISVTTVDRMASNIVRQTVRRLQQLTCYQHESIKTQFLHKSRTTSSSSFIRVSEGHSSRCQRSRFQMVGSLFSTGAGHEENIANTLQTQDREMTKVIPTEEKDLTLQDLLKLVKVHGNTFDEHKVKDVIQLYRQLSNTESDQSELAELDTTPLFDIAIRKAQFMDDRQLAVSLLNLSKSGVHLNSAIMQTFLRQAENRMNYMGAYELAVLCRALDHLPKNQQVTAMLQAIALLSINVIDETVSPSLLASLIISTFRLQPEEMKERFEHRIAATLHVQKHVEVKRLQYVFTSFAKIGHKSDAVLDIASHHLVKHEKIEFVMLRDILIACEKLDYYNAKLLDHSVELIADNLHHDPWLYTVLPSALNLFSSLKFLDKPFLEKAANRFTMKCLKEPDLYRDHVNQLAVCARLLAPYATMNVHPFPERYFLESIEERTLELLSTASSPKRWGYVLDVVYYATLMGSFPVKLLQFVFSKKCEEFVRREVDDREIERRREILRNIHTAVHIECDEVTKGKLELDAVSKVLQVRRRLPDTGKINRRSLLLLSIQDCLTSVVDDQYIVELNVNTDSDLDIDCRVMKTQQTVPGSDEFVNRWAILLAPDSFYAINTLEDTDSMWLLGHHVAKERQLKKLGYDVIWIPVREWANLHTKNQKVEYLKSKFDRKT